jgi:hypothetical protein
MHIKSEVGCGVAARERRGHNDITARRVECAVDAARARWERAMTW